MSFPKAEVIVPDFLWFLLEKNVIQNDKLNKNVAREIFMNEFKPLHNIRRFSFSAMFSYLHFFGIIRFDKRTETIKFLPGVLNEINFDTNRTNRNSFTPANSSKVQNLKTGSSTSSAVYVNSSYKTVCNKDILQCIMCNYVCVNQNTFEKHTNSEEHKLKASYLLKSKKSSNGYLNIYAEVDTGSKEKSETIKLVLQLSKTNITLTLFNKTDLDFDVTNFTVINGTSFIVPQKLVLPHLLVANSKLCLNINIKFVESIYWVYPVIFTLKNKENGSKIEIIKELMIQVCSNLVQDLGPTQPYKKSSRRKYFGRLGYTIIPGIYLEQNLEYFYKPAFKMENYYLSEDVITLLQANLKEFKGITRRQQQLLYDIQYLLEDYKMGNTFNRQSYVDMLKLCLQLEEYQMWCNIKQYDVDNQILKITNFNSNRFFELVVPGLSENRPSILSGDTIFVSNHPDDIIKYEGIVHHVKQNSILFKSSRNFLEKIYSPKSLYFIGFTFNRMTLKAEHQAVQLLKKHKCIDALFKQRVPTAKVIENKNINWFNPCIKSNEMQANAVKCILAKSSAFMPYLIFGPPGTGKTVTIVEAIMQIWIGSNENILVCAPSNSAANEIVTRLSKHIPPKDLFRYVAPSFPKILINDNIQKFANLKHNDYYHPSLELLQGYRIIVSTLTTASRIVNLNVPLKHFSYVFIDESSKATESESLIAIAGILTNLMDPGRINGQVVLAGDFKQLGPIIHSSIADAHGFGISMLQRLITNNPLYKKRNGVYDNLFVTKLVKSYRCHPSIIHVSNKLFYDSELECVGDKTITHAFLGWNGLCNPKFPIIFHSVFGKDEQEENSPSYFNLQEIDVVVKYLGKLINKDINGIRILPEDIGIITPYRKQVDKLKKAFSKKKLPNIMVGTVETFQGHEKLITIISTVRSMKELVEKDIGFYLGFMSNPKRFNVALTRARALLIVVGNPLLLQYDPCWETFIKYCKDNDACGGSLFEFRNARGELESDASSLQLLSGRSTLEENEYLNFSRGNI